MTTEYQLDFLNACAICERHAFDHGMKLVVKQEGEKFIVSGNYTGKDVLFTAYPGGRKILSVAGSKIMNEESL